MIRRLWRKNDKHSVWTKIEQKKYAERKLLKIKSTTLYNKPINWFIERSFRIVYGREISKSVRFMNKEINDKTIIYKCLFP